MKPAAAILLSLILLFNWFGDRLLTFYLEGRADKEAQSRLIGDSYDESGLISLKVPITHLSYYQSSVQFENVSGKIEIKGIQYSYVKRRLYNDTLEVLCIPDQMSIIASAVRNQFFRHAFDLPQIGHGKKHTANTYVSRHFSPDYYQDKSLFQPEPGSFMLTRKLRPGYSPVFSFYVPTHEQPPELI
ncbi:MAG: hypothetical protein JST68_00945 [Bacteroidetes bacterium]|nr:hypothetical protein [Bacteroidota bacterium]